MVDRPWESDEDRKRIAKQQKDAATLNGCIVFVLFAFAALVVIVVLALLGF